MSFPVSRKYNIHSAKLRKHNRRSACSIISEVSVARVEGRSQFVRSLVACLSNPKFDPIILVQRWTVHEYPREEVPTLCLYRTCDMPPRYGPSQSSRGEATRPRLPG